MIEERPDYLVCTCMGVMYSEICQAIEQGCRDYASLQDLLLVGTGCNSCVPEVHDILAQELKQ
jgi:assimilatory nitrate reductase catalytic subunit